MKTLILLIPLIFFGSALVHGDAEPRKSKLLLIIVDGLRYDYHINTSLAGFDAFLTNGSKAEYLKPVFPSTTFPNILSMLTGVYPENHGFVADVLYDPVQHQNFTGDQSNFEKHPFWWNQSDPVWVTAKEQRIRTGIYSLFGCEVPVREILPFYCERYAKLFHQDTLIFETSLREAIIKLSDNTTDFAIVYTEYLDIHGHNYGPSSMEMRKAVKYIDASLQKVMIDIDNYKLGDKLNVIIASDHGMLDTTDRNKVLSLESIIQEDDIEFITGSGTFAGIYPKADKVTKVYDDLKHADWFTTWKKKDIPERFHIKWNNRTAPIIIAAKPSYLIAPLFSDKQIPKPATKVPITRLGSHGYDPSEVKEMNGIFLTRGPDIKKEVTVEAIEMVDVYNMMTCLLNITGHPNNGTWSKVCGLLTSKCNGFCDTHKHSASSATNPLGNWPTIFAAIMITSAMILIRY